ncbi:hypothetical protein CDAR_517031 [Caerostris darwini]|uniref:Uncharacterized protein n=1 Tax=Caerostris darwini TaxID=1538125 RepID=A0AAV4UE64_9ARAC|nr:hypothetical protein CDAR_517031 [Caerostris darwini]
MNYRTDDQKASVLKEKKKKRFPNQKTSSCENKSLCFTSANFSYSPFSLLRGPLSSVCHFGWNGNEKRHLRAITIAANVKKSHQSARNKRSKSRQVPRLITVHLSPQRCPFVCIAQAQGSTTR